MTSSLPLPHESLHHFTLSLSQTDDNDFADLPEEYKRLIGGDLGTNHMVRGLDRELLRKTREQIAKQQGQDIEDAYHQSMVSPTDNDHDDEPIGNGDDGEAVGGDTMGKVDGNGDMVMMMDIHSSWARNLYQSAMAHYGQNANIKEKAKRMNGIMNPKFSNGMVYKFNLNEYGSSIPTEVMRSTVGYGAIVEEFHEFEDDNLDHKICCGFTPRFVIDAVGTALENRGKVEQHRTHKMDRKKRTFSEFAVNDQGNGTKMEKGNDAKTRGEDDDFDILKMWEEIMCVIPMPPPKTRSVDAWRLPLPRKPRRESVN